MKEKTGYAVIRYKISKGDIYDEATVGFFDRFEEAEAEMLSRMAGRDHGVRWPDWEEYEVHLFREGQDQGRVKEP
ncbi:MAG: hypothetical protein GXY14_13525 [Spirochaetes bacterium]|nr:hypothetical protein [Spirochaetota bacterium]